MAPENIKCIICEGSRFTPNYFRPNLYNAKTFNYNKCTTCGSVSISPFPDKDDLDKIYGIEDHDYLKDLKPGEKLIHNFLFPKYNYQRYQVELFDISSKFSKGKKLLDFATGSGFYLAHAQKCDFKTVGVEYNKEFAHMMKEKTGLEIISFEELEANYFNETFDIIHFGHILEHLTDPVSLLKQMKKYAHAETIIIVDGPLEINRCLSRWFIQIGSAFKRHKYNTYAPQHLSFTTYTSQLILFEKAGLKKEYYKVLEQDWPLSVKMRLKSPASIVISIISVISINISKLFPRFGNVFHYAGRFDSKINEK